MDPKIFSKEDLLQIKDHGLSIDEVQRHLDLFKLPPPYLRLLRPCVPGDGITVIDQEKMETLEKIYNLECPKLRCLKFVPASGAATRMFKTLLQFEKQEQEIDKESIERRSHKGKKDAQQILEIINGIKKFAFFRDLKSVMSKKNLDIDALLLNGQFTDIIRFLLTEEGLNYANLPKALLKFHKYPAGNRTALEEHLVEAAAYVANQNRQCNIHFTISKEHLNKFESLLRKVKPYYEEKYRVSLHVAFSTQNKSTDTLAVDMGNRPFRLKQGRLLFRPGGHGALVKNLNDLDTDIVFIKNTDNVVPDRLKLTTFKWKKILCGYLVSMQKKIFYYMNELSSGPAEDAFLDQLIAKIHKEIPITLPTSVPTVSPCDKRAFIMERLNRPIRVCGIVKSKGEPGGGPFWVRDQNGESSLQIVEKGQIDPGSEEQQDILASSACFNPVDLVCGVRDWLGGPFDLRKYVDPNAVLISRKSKDGTGLKALEHPGLWNGAMSRWITVFVEVPGITFNPVKTLNDLLRKEHQP